MGQCTSKQHQQAVVAAMERGPSSSSMSRASSTFNNLTKYLAENPPRRDSSMKKGRSSFGLRDSASAPVGEELSCSATFNMSMEMSDRSSLALFNNSCSSGRSKSPMRRTSNGSGTNGSGSHHKRSSPFRTTSNESAKRCPSRTSSADSNGSAHCWAALRDVTDRDYSTGGGGLDPLPEELAMRSSATTTTSAPNNEEVLLVAPGEEEKEEEMAAAATGEVLAIGEVLVTGEVLAEEQAASTRSITIGGGEEAALAAGAGAAAAAGKEDTTGRAATSRRNSRKRSARNWKRSSNVYNKQQQQQQQQGQQESCGEQGGSHKSRNSKESSWQALSCTSKNSDMYESYGSSNRSWQMFLFNDSRDGSAVDLARYEKDAMNNMHGFCFTESEAEDDEQDTSDDEYHDERQENEHQRKMKEDMFWETNALRS